MQEWFAQFHRDLKIPWHDRSALKCFAFCVTILFALLGGTTLLVWLFGESTGADLLTLAEIIFISSIGGGAGAVVAWIAP